MQPVLSEEHEMMRHAVADLVEREVKPNALQWERDGEVPRSLFSKLAELGYLGVRLSPEFGGGGQDFWFTAVLLQELMKSGSIGVAVAIMAHAEFATKVIDRGGSSALKEKYVRPAAEGKLIGALGVSEPDAGSDVAALKTRAVRDGSDYVINGSKLYISNGTIADYITTAVRTGGEGHRGISLIVVPADSEGLTRRRLQKIGTHASDTAEIFFDDVRVPASNLVGEENRGFGLIMGGFEGERLVLSVMACSQARMLFEEARRWGHDRQAFGQPLLGFQVWQHRLADVLTNIEAAEALMIQAIDKYTRGEDANSLISMSKLFATEMALDTARECAQIQGGLSHMDECLIGRLYRDSLALTIGAGTSETMRGIIARSEDLVARGQ
ncbi:MAG: acyl-CoA dehydrogenase family protein [Pseudomonadales bacterium]|jgi:citronellyl-CoA dehydrogenase|nr:acyl-CoA dehydrogenase family protein [Pseudomonadales bacterium]MDP6470298.1 acyl-CoA dehydrogenase family protein [Pseudomonadales bacterium]MDP6827204.1 acyl-CoA dehydrogenase family protein [Pseudomonadales bacterium]MDP6972494.1 acyl-CoA dehydrogenase family protein [Pseudomonadales bacterium]